MTFNVYYTLNMLPIDRKGLQLRQWNQLDLKWKIISNEKKKVLFSLIYVEQFFSHMARIKLPNM